MEALLALRELKKAGQLDSIQDKEGPDGAVTYDFGHGRLFAEDMAVPFHDASNVAFPLRALVLYYRITSYVPYMRAMTSAKGGPNAKKFLGMKDREELEKFMAEKDTPRVSASTAGLTPAAGGMAEAGGKSAMPRRPGLYALETLENVLCRAGHDFSIALEVVQALKKREDEAAGRSRSRDGRSGEKRARPSGASPDEQNKRAKGAYIVGKDGRRIRRRPIIMVPASRSALVQMINFRHLVDQGNYQTAREVEAAGEKRTSEALLRHTVDGHRLEFLVLDAPHRVHPQQWADVVAVVVDGQAWQFKQYPWKNLVDMFEAAVGVHFRYKDEAEPATVKGWKVHRLTLERAQRHADRLVAAQFWRSLEAHLRHKRPEFLPDPRQKH